MNLKRYFIYLSSAVLLLLLSACSPAPAQKGFLLALSSSQLNLFQGFGDEVAVQIMRTGGFSGAVELSIVGLPQEISASFSDSPTQANSVVLGLMTSSTIVEQSLTVTIKGSSEGLEHQVTLSLEVLTEFAQGSHPGYAPDKKGELKTISIKGKEFTYEVIDGLAIYQSDMILGEADKIAAQLASISALQPAGVTCDDDTIATLFGWFCGKWSDGIVPYSLKNDWGSDANNTEMRRRISLAIAHWQTETNLRFVQRNEGVRLEFKNSAGCSSSVGRQENIFGEPQSVNLSMGCGVAAIVHEMGHAIGLYHEQSRADRDSYVRIFPENVQDGKGHNFNKHVDDGIDVGPYDFESIMHYGCNDFGNGAGPTLQPLDASISCSTLGMGSTLSDGDILSSYSLYPPGFSITGASDGDTIARNLVKDFGLSFTVEPVDAAYIQWSSNRVTDLLGSGNATLALALWTLPEGAHTITASVVIQGVLVASDSVAITLENVAPTVNIFEPTAGEEFCSGQEVTFRATVGDVDTLPGQTLPGSSVSWRVGSEAAFATGTTVSRSFTPGTYTVTATATDAEGASGSDSVGITVVTCTQDPPTATIANPAESGSSFDLEVTPVTSDANGFYHEITLQGSATDPEDGALTGSSLVWTTDKADVQPGGPGSGIQQLGTGTSVSVKLYTSCSGAYFGTVDHLITLTATDSGGLTDIITRLIRVVTLC